MRVPKFRALDRLTGKMFPVGIIDYSIQSVYIEEPNGMYCERDFDEVELIQPTGLKDINGEEVYEGDIIVTPFEEDGLLVVYLDTTAGVYVKNLLSGNIQFIGDPGSLEELKELKDELSQSIEIKGNIWENKDLLGEEK